jgi:hypothetical protein
MKIIENKIIPFKGFIAINLFGLVFVKTGTKLSERTKNHEAIHTAQQRELLFVLFYVVYVIEWFVRLVIPGAHNAYRSVSFEQEAKSYEGERDYLKYRKPYRWLSYLLSFKK